MLVVFANIFSRCLKRWTCYLIYFMLFVHQLFCESNNTVYPLYSIAAMCFHLSRCQHITICKSNIPGIKVYIVPWSFCLRSKTLVTNALWSPCSISSVYGTPTMFVDILSAVHDRSGPPTPPPHLYTGLIGASPCPPQLVNDIITKLNMKHFLVRKHNYLLLIL